MLTLAAMCRQEEQAYQTSKDVYYNSSSSNNMAVDADCRDKMVQWTCQVVEFLKFSQETVAISMNYLDRYCMVSPQAREDRNHYQLATMTALYTAVKLHEPVAMEPKMISMLSHGAYSAQQVEEMEQEMLAALQWRMNPPTALSFVRLLLDLIALDTMTKKTVYDISKYQTEIAVQDVRFVSVKASTTAFCSLMNALESLQTMDEKALTQVAHVFQLAIGMESSNDSHLAAISDALYQAVAGAGPMPAACQQQHEAQQHCTASQHQSSSKEGIFYEESPRAVVA